MDKKLGVYEILQIIVDKEARITHEQVVQVYEAYDQLTQSQKDSINDYCRRVPYSHPRWTLPPRAIKIGEVTVTPEQQYKANEQLRAMVKHFKGMDIDFNALEAENSKEGK